MKSREEIKEWLLENCIDENGDLYLSNLDFSDFKGDVYFNFIKVKNNLYQCYQEVGRNLIQSRQTVGRGLYQGYQKVGGDMQDYNNEVKGEYVTQTLKNNEEYKIENGETYIVKKTKKLTKQEIEELLGYKIEIVG